MFFAGCALRAKKFGCAAGMLLLALFLCPQSTSAQATVTFTFSGGSFASPTSADYKSGHVEATSPMSFQIVTTSEAQGPHQTTLDIRSSSSTLGSGKSVADLEWRRGDLSTWNALTTVDHIVQTFVGTHSPTGHTYSNTIYFRILLHWTGTVPATYAGHIVLTVTHNKP